MEFISKSDNEKAIKALKKGQDISWNIFWYGDKESGTRPGDINVYKTIAGQKEVLKGREELKKQMEQSEENSPEL